MATTALDAPRVAPRRRVLVRPPLIKRVPRPKITPAESFIDRLDRMGYERRLAAYRRGELTRRERTVWAARFPDEVPLVNGELEWIALAAADLD
jgi:hypothetical protein